MKNKEPVTSLCQSPPVVFLHSPHRCLCTAESPSLQRYWSPNSPSDQTLWSVTKKKWFLLLIKACNWVNMRSAGRRGDWKWIILNACRSGLTFKKEPQRAVTLNGTLEMNVSWGRVRSEEDLWLIVMEDTLMLSPWWLEPLCRALWCWDFLLSLVSVLWWRNQHGEIILASTIHSHHTGIRNEAVLLYANYGGSEGQNITSQNMLNTSGVHRGGPGGINPLFFLPNC